MKCEICETRKARRHCPGIRGDICSICCGTERENTVDCPFDCVFLREARLHDPRPQPDPATFPNRDIRIPERFLQEHARTVNMVTEVVLHAVFSTRGAIDHDVREALDALIRTYRTLQSGLVYESRPANPVAANIYQITQEQIAERRRRIAEQTGSSVRDAEILASLVMLQRLEYIENNGRKRGRAFIDYARTRMDNPEAAAPAAGPLISA